ncbi:hypothetical protein GMA11_04945 [Granulicatella sp. zg-ZJ]|uniref:CdaR family protein n=1 Tax=Granulicatella sp. zg-ZJ TaxID=2678504 RepID=UPI0013D4C43E|nr:CdaR family protein [Granulicatella sp. zg-ZJ]MBS4750869.1 hypothetical protein [Carnobacteriaceae bacterium zg-ZUI78]NEW62736.1 hypothetical protein [Granulicatella sp. zg-ZJ]
MEKWLKNKYIVVFVSFLLSVLLASFIYSRHDALTTNIDSSASVTTQKIITNVPIRIKDSSNSKYISGLPEHVVVSLEGPRNILSQLSNQTINVETEDLATVENGSTTIRYKLTDLPNGVIGTIQPYESNIIVSKRMTKTFPVTPLVDKSIVSDGYVMGAVEVSPSTVSITGSEDTILKIDTVTATITVSSTKTETFTQDNVSVVVKDKNGNILDVKVDKNVSITVPIYKKGQTVPVDITLAGQREGYTYTVESQNVSELTLLGTADKLKDITRISATINVSDLTETKTLEATVLVPIGVTISNPQPITATIKVEKQ